ncbi:PLP-dependent aminotransferase family protein [Glaciibacter superstes]|uniref:MocR-like pyridoxine biosynthesis transcription factor PdxR n=1 Tax=Glaciibacter superstes TaxID=501023 RepID=UPI0003B4AE2C|nr:PLP-dependent aminotransferase family protein [Glaciibacter superstes]
MTLDFANRLAVSRNTVAIAYERLTVEGYLDSAVGSGTFVSANAALSVNAAPSRGGRQAPVTGLKPRRERRGVLDDSEPPPGPIAFDFSMGTPDAAVFPLDTWRRSVAHAIRPAIIGTGGYRDPAGSGTLRQAIARHIGVSRSVRAGANDVLVTQGAQQAFDLVARVLIEPGDVVAVEEPGYPPVRGLFESMGARVVGVPVDAEGLVVSAIPARTKLVYITPSHQFPLGTVMTLRRRRELLAWAGRHDAAILEDDYDTEFRYGNRALDPLQSLDRDGRVVYVGTFSKTMLPMIRIGFLIAPLMLQPALRRAKLLADWQGESTTQAAAAEFIDKGHLARHIRKAGREYAARRECIVRTVRSDFADVLELFPSSAGLHVSARVIDDLVDVGQVVANAGVLGVRVQSLGRFCAESPGVRGLALGFGTIALEDIPDGLRLLAGAIDRARAGRPAT